MDVPVVGGIVLNMFVRKGRTEDGPVDSVQVYGWITLSNGVIDAVVEVRRPIISTPVDQILWRL